MLGVIFLWFLAFKRPIYEGILISFAALLTITGTWSNTLDFIKEALGTNLLDSMMIFTAMSHFSVKKIIDNCVMIILSLLGKIPGGAGYASVAAIIIGGDTAAKICDFIYKDLYPHIIYLSSVSILIGLVKMYVAGQKALVPPKKKKSESK